MTTPLDIALGYIARGWSPIPVPTRAKGPVIEGWQNLRIDRDSAPRFFDGTAQNIGVLTGPASRDLVDVDLDTAEARKLAPAYLPATGSTFGRPGSPPSHWLYCAAGIRRLEYRDKETRELLLELRGAGHQTIFPGSVHECGEPIEWAEDGEPAAGCADDLKAAVG